MVEHYLDTVGVSSSTLLVPTIFILNSLTRAAVGLSFPAEVLIILRFVTYAAAAPAVGRYNFSIRCFRRTLPRPRLLRPASNGGISKRYAFRREALTGKVALIGSDLG